MVELFGKTIVIFKFNRSNSNGCTNIGERTTDDVIAYRHLGIGIKI